MSSIFVVDSERRPVGICEAEEVARILESGERSLSRAIDRFVPSVRRDTPLREVLPLFVERKLPVAVVGERGRLEG
ncbi:CBS domain-containing protein, partial [Escherichia coli]|nr:CBS domain-containing protein [Escherichia coli]